MHEFRSGVMTRRVESRFEKNSIARMKFLIQSFSNSIIEFRTKFSLFLFLQIIPSSVSEARYKL